MVVVSIPDETARHASAGLLLVVVVLLLRKRRRRRRAHTVVHL